MSMMNPKTNRPEQAQLDWHKEKLAIASMFGGEGMFTILPGFGGCTDDNSDDKLHIYLVKSASKAVALIEGPAEGEYHQFTKKCIEALGYRMVPAECLASEAHCN